MSWNRDWVFFFFFFLRISSVSHKTRVSNYPTRCNNIHFIYICKLLYMFRVVSPPIIRASYHCIYSIWHFWDRYCYLSWTSRTWLVAVTVSLVPDTVDTVIWAPDDGWRYYPKHAQQFADINELYIVASCCTIIDTLRDTRTIEHKTHKTSFQAM